MTVFQDPRFSQKLPGNVAYGFFGRQGGVSTGENASLNADARKDDSAQNVAQNRRIIMNELGAGAPAMLLTLDQVHGTECIVVDDPLPYADGWTKADALVTTRPGIALGILTADCAPVLLAGATRSGAPVIGAAHAGWRGAVDGILQSTIAAMKDCGAEEDTICASVGPCIGARASVYEVTEDFMEPFLQQSPENYRFFKSTDNLGYVFFDFQDYVEHELRRGGIAHVSCVRRDTCYEEDAFFSYRRCMQRKERDGGRQLSTIVIRNAAEGV